MQSSVVRRRSLGKAKAHRRFSDWPGTPAHCLAQSKSMKETMIFRDRRAGGEALAGLLQEYTGRDDVIVLALPRGGVPVADEIANRLGVAMDVFVVRKLGVPQQPELALGAIASGGVRVIDPDTVQALGIPDSAIETVARREQQELERRERLYRGERSAPELEDK